MTINNRKILSLILFVTMSFATQSYAFCIQPSAWHISTPTKPIVPFCINQFTNTHNCDSWTISRYNSEVVFYNDALERYYAELDDYIDDVNVYVRCMYRAVE
ncbi:MAG: hypothetical protein OXH90_04735 [Paracoccaceae bacterium]|nr:hypothetical protein [Paracoccaceae bacterium]MDE2917873.1 hypothetical protein [Paracoccaceae bacterium]